MTVYADVLMLVNFVVDYFLILISGLFLHKKTRLWRVLTASALGGIFSLYIFLPQINFFINCSAQIIMCALMSLVTFGFGKIKDYCRCVVALFCVNFAYSGAMIALWLVFKPRGMVINNSVVYFNVSPLFLIVFSVVGYFVTILIKKILKRPFSQDVYCSVMIFCENKNLELNGIVDTGNSIVDVFGMSEIFITEEKFVDLLLGEQKQNPARFRKIPCSTIAGEKLLNGYRVDEAYVNFNNKKYVFKNPILAVSTTPLDDSQIIVNPENLN